MTMTFCGQPAVNKHLTDKIYLTAPDLAEQLSVSYHFSNSSYLNLVDETVIAVGYNDQFVIVKQRPSNKDTVFYYIIDIKEIKKERDKFVSKIDTIRYRSHYTNINGEDSLGSEQIQIFTTKFSPMPPDNLTFEEFETKRKQLKVPETLDFTINYD